VKWLARSAVDSGVRDSNLLQNRIICWDFWSTGAPILPS